jgi:hypothetical protein
VLDDSIWGLACIRLLSCHSDGEPHDLFNGGTPAKRSGGKSRSSSKTCARPAIAALPADGRMAQEIEPGTKLNSERGPHRATESIGAMRLHAGQPVQCYAGPAQHWIVLPRAHVHDVAVIQGADKLNCVRKAGAVPARDGDDDHAPIVKLSNSNSRPLAFDSS